ncbi:MAG: ADP-forming succinate--CoA ligase subunit beta [Anaerolineae bacterium]|nr:ADP-forming succinate--CoA ligase subunit beta [Anaerolineae bacterium]
MKLQEYQSKRIFAQYGVPVPEGGIATTPQEAREIAKRLGKPVVVKAQVLVGGRGKAGGIKLAETPEEAGSVAAQILAMDIKGLPVRSVLVEEAADIASEIYLSMVIDRAAKRPVMMASSEGGIEIEEVARQTPEKIVKTPVDPFPGLWDYQVREVAYGIGLGNDLIRGFGRVAKGLYTAFTKSDASLAEINPLVVTAGGTLLAVDAKMLLDDNALFRHPELAEMRSLEEEMPAEREARGYGISYVQLDGTIGCMVNGAGLAMATMDLTKLYGGAPANFLDIGGGAKADKVAAALRLILSDLKVKVVLINVFGGITRCDEVARGIVEALEEVETDVPMVARLVGTNEEEGRAILAEAEMITAATLEEAAQKAVEAARGGLAGGVTNAPSQLTHTLR